MKIYSHPAVCDPVMGDDGRLYVSKDLVPAYRDQLISLATVLTPNQYEAELLTGTKINSKASALAACQALHQRGVATVVRLHVAADCCMLQFCHQFVHGALFLARSVVVKGNSLAGLESNIVYTAVTATYSVAVTSCVHYAQVITSIRLKDLKGELLLIASTQTTQKSGCPTRIQVNIPMLDAYFTGTGKPSC